MGPSTRMQSALYSIVDNLRGCCFKLEVEIYYCKYKTGLRETNISDNSQQGLWEGCGVGWEGLGEERRGVGWKRKMCFDFVFFS